MRKHVRNLLIASIIYVVVFILIIIFSALYPVIYMDGEAPEDEWFYIFSIFTSLVISLGWYFFFYKRQRKKADTDINLQYLGYGTRIIEALIPSLFVAVILMVLCFLGPVWTDIETILRSNFNVMTGIIAVWLITNLAVFIVFKPRP